MAVLSLLIELCFQLLTAIFPNRQPSLARIEFFTSQLHVLL